MATVLWPSRSLTILGVDAVGKRKRRARMPQVVEANTRQREGGQAVQGSITDVGMEQTPSPRSPAITQAPPGRCSIVLKKTMTSAALAGC